MNYRHVILDPAQQTVRYTQPGVRIDLGGIAILQERGVAQGYAAATIIRPTPTRSDGPSKTAWVLRPARALETTTSWTTSTRSSWIIAHALPVMLLSGLPFVFARPQRYLTNPVFGLKFALLLPAIALAALLHINGTRKPDYWGTKLIAAASLLLWIGVVLAGRWIAYVDYLFPPEE